MKFLKKGLLFSLVVVSFAFVSLFSRIQKFEPALFGQRLLGSVRQDSIFEGLLDELFKKFESNEITLEQLSDVINVRDEEKKTVLMRALESSHRNNAVLLYNRLSNVLGQNRKPRLELYRIINSSDIYGNTLFGQAIFHGKNNQFAQSLLSEMLKLKERGLINGKDFFNTISVKNEANYTPLLFAVVGGNTSMALALLDQAQSLFKDGFVTKKQLSDFLNSATVFSETAMDWAKKKGYSKVVQKIEKLKKL